MLCLHHNDADGLCAGAIVRRCFGDAVELYQIDYGYPIPWQKIDAAQTVIITDFSLPKPDMQKIYEAKGDNFIWIDHHISAIKDMADMPNLPGVRDVDKAACVLTWEYFFPEYEVPAAVHFIGDRDIWRFDYLQTRAFCQGLFYADTQADNDELWTPLLGNDEAPVQEFIDQGEMLLQAHMKDIVRLVAGYGFETTFAGYRTMAINLPSSGDIGHYICSLGYDVAYVYVDDFQDGKLVTKVTLYSDTIDVSVLAKTHGGGGHKGAAGFRFIRAGNSPLPEAT